MTTNATSCSSSTSLLSTKVDNEIRLVASKSLEYNKSKESNMISPERSTSLTLAERRRIPASLKLSSSSSSSSPEKPCFDEILITQIIKKLSPSPQQQQVEEEIKEYKEFLLNPMDVKKRMTLRRQAEFPQAIRGTLWKALVQPSEKIKIMYQQLNSGGVGPYDTLIDQDIQDPTIARILKAYSVYDVRVGYHSSLIQLVKPLLSTNMPENEIFSVFVRWMETYDMRQLYMLNMEGLDQLLHQFQLLLTSTFPTLATHLSRCSVEPAMYATSWFLTCFNGSCLNLIFLQGALPTLLRMALYTCQKQEKMLLAMTDPHVMLDILSAATVNDVQGILPYSGLVTTVSIQPQQQVQDLVYSYTKLQKEHSNLSRDVKMLRMHEMDQEATQLKLVKRNTVLEKRVKKYKVKLANAVVVPAEEQQRSTTTTTTKRQDQFSLFVASLRDTGEFGALIAGALTPTTTVESLTVANKEQEQPKLEEDTSFQQITSELVQVKLEHFETCQRYQSLMTHYQELTGQLKTMQSSHMALCQKVIYLESELEDVVMERDQIYADQEDVLAMTMVAKKTCAELQLEKMDLLKYVERLEFQVKALEIEKQEFFMPRGTFTEEVFAAHSILFGASSTTKQEDHRRHSLQQVVQEPNEYKQKFVESELRCRELEKYLAETKVKLVELECNVVESPTSRRASFVHHNPHRASLSMLAKRSSLPPPPPQQQQQRRGSTESYASSVTSLTSSGSQYTTSHKRRSSSMYSRIWNAFGSPPATPTTATTNTTLLKNSNAINIMCQEPQII